MTKSIFTPEYQLFLKLLLQGRKKAGMTQVQLAAQLKKPQSFVCKFEKGERRLDIIEFLEIARILNIDAGEIIQRLQK